MPNRYGAGAFLGLFELFPERDCISNQAELNGTFAVIGLDFITFHVGIGLDFVIFQS
jgi:hypothetical protein